MKNAVIFIVTLLIGFGLGYLFFKGGDDEQQIAENNEGTENADTTDEETAETEDPAGTAHEESPQSEQVSAEGPILMDNGCISCHSVTALNLQGGATRPDLSQSYYNVEGKHGKSLDEFLKAPTSSVMATVIQGNPLSDEQRTQIVEALKKQQSIHETRIPDLLIENSLIPPKGSGSNHICLNSSFT